MSLDEIRSWINGTPCIDYAHEDRDSCDNLWQERIYKKDGKLYSIKFLNNHPCEVWNGKGYVRGEYEFKEVARHEKQITITKVFYKKVKK